jgi:hypothetical protein
MKARLQLVAARGLPVIMVIMGIALSACQKTGGSGPGY